MMILNWKVYDLEESVTASKNAFRINPVHHSEEEFKKCLERATALAKCGGGSGHSNFRKGIRVSFDMTYSLKLSPQLQRYGFVDIVSSSSTMHMLTKMNPRECCNNYVTEKAIENLEECINEYNKFKEELESRGRETWSDKDKKLLEFYFHKCIYNIPSGFELFMRCSTNYEQLATIYRQRKHHRLYEWREFCAWIETLPYAKELIICE